MNATEPKEQQFLTAKFSMASEKTQASSTCVVVHVYVGGIVVRGRPGPVRLNTLWRPSRAIDPVLTRVP